MKDKIALLLKEIELFNAANAEEIEQFRIKYAGKKGILAVLFADLKTVPEENRKEAGILLNKLKDTQLTGKLKI